MSDELKVWREAVMTQFGCTSDKKPDAAAAVIEADREAVRAEQAAELAKYKALAETLAGALEAIRSEAQREEGSWLHLKRCIAAQSAEALRKWEEARDAS